jgi:hypothetical protein
MAFSFIKNAKPIVTGGGASGSKKTYQPSDDDAVEKPKANIKKEVGFSFLKRGKKSTQAFVHEEAKAAAQQIEFDKMWRFMLQPDEDKKATFLDGELNDEGMLDITTFYEHFLKVNGKPRNFICVAETDEPEECPICERGDSGKTFVGALTVLDHTKHKIQSGPNAGKIIQNDRKLFIAKRGTLKMLTKMAIAREGLAGCQFNISRGNNQTPSVGNVFDFQYKFESYDEIAAKYELPLEEVAPAVYDDELTFYTAAELIELGVGKVIAGPGYGGKGGVTGGTFGKKKVSASGMASKL